jgi:hypothetical protein
MLETTALNLGNFNRPFIRVGNNHLISVSSITEVDYIPDGVVYTVGDFVYYDDTNLDDHVGEVNTVKTPIIVIQFVNQEGEPDMVRRTGKWASGLWETLATFLALP